MTLNHLGDGGLLLALQVVVAAPTVGSVVAHIHFGQAPVGHGQLLLTLLVVVQTLRCLLGASLLALARSLQIELAAHVGPFLWSLVVRHIVIPILILSLVLVKWNV